MTDLDDDTQESIRRVGSQPGQRGVPPRQGADNQTEDRAGNPAGDWAGNRTGNPAGDQTELSQRRISAAADDNTELSLRKRRSAAGGSSAAGAGCAADQTAISTRSRGAETTEANSASPANSAPGAVPRRRFVSSTARIAYDPNRDGVERTTYAPRELPPVSRRPPRQLRPPTPLPRQVGRRPSGNRWGWLIGLGIGGAIVVGALVALIVYLGA